MASTIAKVHRLQLSARNRDRIAKVKTQAADVLKRSRVAAKESEQDIVSVVGAVGLGYAQKSQMLAKLPTVGGFDPLMLYGGLGYLLTRKAKGKPAMYAHSVAKAAVLVSAFNLGSRGSLTVAGDESGNDDTTGEDPDVSGAIDDD